MEKFIAFLVSLGLVFALVSCSTVQHHSTSEPETHAMGSKTASHTEPSGTSSTENPDVTNASEPPREVTVIVPSLFFDGIDSGSFDPEQYASENGFICAIVNEDQSVSITMTEAKQEELLCELVKTIDEWLAQCIESEETPYIKGITHSDGFETITISVDPIEYQNASGLTTLSFVIYAIMYHSFAGTDSTIEIITADVTNGNILNSQIFPLSDTAE